MDEESTQNPRNFELGSKESMNVPIWIIVGFQQRDRQDSHNFNNDTFYRPPVTSAQSIFGIEKDTDSGFLLNYNDDDYSKGYGQTKKAFKAPTKDDLLNHIY